MTSSVLAHAGEEGYLSIKLSDDSVDIIPVYEIILNSDEFTLSDDDEGTASFGLSAGATGLSEADADLLYLRLDTTNDPLTGTLTIDNDGKALSIRTAAGVEKIFTNLNAGNAEMSFDDSAGNKDIFLATAGDSYFINDLLIGGATKSNAHIILDSDGSAVFNEQGADQDFRIEGDTATKLFVANAGTNTIEIGTVTDGAIAKFAPTEITFNEFGSATIDFRVEGDTISNLLFVDASLDAIGIAIAPVAGTRLTLPQENDAVTPTIAFGDGDTGFYETTDDSLVIAIAGAEVGRWNFQGLGFGGLTNRPGFRNETTTSTNPTFLPHFGDPDTGMGGAGFNSLSLIAGGVEMMKISETFIDNTIIMTVQGVGINEAAPDAMLEIATDAATEEGLHIKGTASQSASLFIMTDSADVGFVDFGDGLAGSEIAFNQNQADIDFRIGSVTNINGLIFDASQGRLGVFNQSTSLVNAFSVAGAWSGFTSKSLFVVETDDSNAGIRIIMNDSQHQHLDTIIRTVTHADAFLMDGGTDTLTLGVLGTGVLHADSNGVISSSLIDFPDIKYDNSLVGNPAFAVDECYFFADTSGGGFICEGSTANTNEQIYRFPNVDGADTDENIAIGGGAFHDGFSDFATNEHFDTSTLTMGSIPFSDGTTFVEDNVGLFYDNTGNRLGLGTVTPVYPLDIVGNTAQVQLRLGDPTTDATTKIGGFVMRHYTNAEEDIAGLISLALVNANVLFWGGGSGFLNTATEHRFYTAANNTTTGGTLRFSILSSGRIGINEAASDAMLEIVTNATTEEGLKIKGSASQSANLFLMTDSSDVTFMSSGDGLAGSEIVWNEAGADINWRHESDNAANLLFLDAGLDTGAGGIGVFGTSPQIQQATIVDADGTLADITTKFNTLLADLEGYGWLKTS